jgi:hypothetical protein
MMALVRLFIAAALIAVIGFGAYQLTEPQTGPQQAAAAIPVEAADPADPDLATMRDLRKKARAAAKFAGGEGCTQLRADYEVWEDYLDKKTRQKLKALIAKCDKAGDAQVSAEP